MDVVYSIVCGWEKDMKELFLNQYTDMALADSTAAACRLCPRECGVNRELDTGFCGCKSKVLAARAALHQWEEPWISGIRGSGTVFFSGCTLGCCFCQNHVISHQRFGKSQPEKEKHQNCADQRLRQNSVCFCGTEFADGENDQNNGQSVNSCQKNLSFIIQRRSHS